MYKRQVWGKFTWGTWWVWGDARLNLTAILLLVYLGYLASRRFSDDIAKTAKNSSFIGIFGIIQIPILHFSVIWWRSVHQQATILSQETVSSGDAPMSPDILTTLLISVYWSHWFMYSYQKNSELLLTKYGMII